MGAQGPRASASPARARQVLLPSWGPAATAEILNKCYYGPYHGVRRVSTQTFCGNDTAVWHFICLYCILTQGCFFIAFRETDRGGQGDREEHRCEREASIDWLSPAHARIRDRTRNLGLCPDRESNQTFWSTGQRPTRGATLARATVSHLKTITRKPMAFENNPNCFFSPSPPFLTHGPSLPVSRSHNTHSSPCSSKSCTST